MPRTGIGASTRSHKRHNRYIRRVVHKRLKPFINSNVARLCEGRKIGYFDTTNIAHEFTRGHNKLKNGDFESDESIRGIPDGWSFDLEVNGDSQHASGQTYLKEKASFSTIGGSSFGASYINVGSVAGWSPGDPILFEATWQKTNVPASKNGPWISSTSEIDVTCSVNWTHKNITLTGMQNITPEWFAYHLTFQNQTYYSHARPAIYPTGNNPVTTYGSSNVNNAIQQAQALDPDNVPFLTTPNGLSGPYLYIDSITNNGDGSVSISLYYAYPNGNSMGKSTDSIFFKLIQHDVLDDGHPISKYRHKGREHAWIDYSWNGAASKVLLDHALYYSHPKGDLVNKMFCCVDGRAAINNPQTFLGAYSGINSLRLDVSASNQTAIVTSDWFNVNPGELYFISMAGVRAPAGPSSSYSPYSGASNPNGGLGFQIQWGREGHNHPSASVSTAPLIPLNYVLSSSDWEYIETIVQAPGKAGTRPYYLPAWANHPKGANRARIIISNVGQVGSPIWVDDVRVVDMSLHKWNKRFFNPGANSIGNSVFIHEHHHSHNVPTAQYPDATTFEPGSGNVDCNVYVEDYPRDVVGRVSIDAHVKIADPKCSVGITYSINALNDVNVQPLEYYMVRVDGGSCNDSHGACPAHAQLIHAVFTGGTWNYTYLGATSDSASTNLSGDYEKYYHGVKLMHDPDNSSYGGTHGAIIGYAFGKAFAGASCSFRNGLPGLMGGDGGLRAIKLNGQWVSGHVRDYHVTTEYPKLSHKISNTYSRKCPAPTNVWSPRQFTTFNALSKFQVDNLWKINFWFQDQTTNDTGSKFFFINGASPPSSSWTNSASTFSVETDDLTGGPILWIDGLTNNNDGTWTLAYYYCFPTFSTSTNFYIQLHQINAALYE